MTLANKLTVLRVALVPVFIIFTIIDNLWTRVFALVIFIAASLTDYYDGMLARKHGEITDFGKLMDPLADKLIVSAAFISFVDMRELNVPPWMVVLIIGREFLITGMRTLAASKGVVIPADRAGKFKMTSQITAIITILVILCVNSVLSRFYGIHTYELLQLSGWPYVAGALLYWSSYWLVFIAAVFTIVSGFSYCYRHWHLVHPDAGRPS